MLCMYMQETNFDRRTLYLFQVLSTFMKCYLRNRNLWAFMAVRLAKQETLTPPGHLVSPLVCRGPWMSTVVLYFWCHSDSASVLLYFTFEYGGNWRRYSLSFIHKIAWKLDFKCFLFMLCLTFYLLILIVIIIILFISKSYNLNFAGHRWQQW